MIIRYKYIILLIAGLIIFNSCRQKLEPPTKELSEQDISDHPYNLVAKEATKRNWLRPPYKYWAIKNVDKLFDTGTIRKAETPVLFDSDLQSYADIVIEQYDGRNYGFEEHLDSNRTDGFLILHQGKIAYEKYWTNMTETSTHNWFSMSKSITGLTVDILAEEGLIDKAALTLDYLPELKGSAWEGSTVQMVMDMLVGIKYSEKYNDPTSDAYKFAKISEFVDVPGPPSEYASVYEYMQEIEKGRNHDELFHYVSLNTEILGMIITKVTGKPPSEVISDRIWSKIGTEKDAFVVQNKNGYQLVSAAINSTLRDAGRLGQLLINDGMHNGEQVVPKIIVETIKKGGSIEKFADSKRGKVFKNFSYKNQWWHTDNTAFFAKGLFGQWLYIDPKIDLVVVKFTTSDIPTSTEIDWINNMNLMDAIVQHITNQ